MHDFYKLLVACAPFLHRQVELVNPRLLVTLGNVPTQALFSTSQGITRMRGKWFTWDRPGGGTIPLLPTFHPAFLLRSPSQKREAWMDLLAAKKKLSEAESP